MALHKEDIKRLKIVQRYIQSNLNGDLSIDVLCQKIAVSRSTLQRHFALYLNKTVHDYILEQRLCKALELLCDRSKNVTEIASLVGFTDRCSFSHAFRKFFGLPPKNCYRNSPH